MIDDFPILMIDDRKLVMMRVDDASSPMIEWLMDIILHIFL